MLTLIGYLTSPRAFVILTDCTASTTYKCNQSMLLLQYQKGKKTEHIMATQFRNRFPSTRYEQEDYHYNKGFLRESLLACLAKISSS